MENETIKIKGKNITTFYKIGFIIVIIILAFFLGVVFHSNFASATAWPLDKNATCNLFNKTGNDCDAYWCNSIQEKVWNASDSICTEIVYINTTIYVNITSNLSDNLTLFCQNYTLNVTNLADSNLSASMKEYIDNQTLTLKNNLLGVIDNQTALNRNNQYSSTPAPEPIPWYMYVMITGIIGAVIVFLAWNSGKIKKDMTPKSLKRTFNTNKFVGIEEKQKPKEIKMPTQEPESTQSEEESYE
jgi:hypothetical protein